jgi:CRISPR/Cas system CSM-associated protein Csm3 (group 7 of RAMP superfamily)
MLVTITFHGPFRVATGSARGGTDETVDLADPLPASSLKGLMRACARELLPGARGLVDAVFGTAAEPSPWHWEPVVFATTPQPHTRARVKIDPVTGTAADGHLMFGEELWATTGRFRVTGPGHWIHPHPEEDHRTVLVCAAAGVKSLGADRRRGLGWVSLVPDAPIDAACAQRLLDLGKEWGPR